MVKCKNVFVSLYYSIWADIIVRYRKQHPDNSDWQIRYILLVYISTANSWSIWILLSIIELFGLMKIHWLKFNILPTERLNSGVSYFIMFVLPCILINYFLIFRRKRYMKIIEIYATTKGNYGDIYIKSILIFAAITVFGYGIISGNLFK